MGRLRRERPVRNLDSCAVDQWMRSLLQGSKAVRGGTGVVVSNESRQFAVLCKRSCDFMAIAISVHCDENHAHLNPTSSIDSTWSKSLQEDLVVAIVETQG